MTTSVTRLYFTTQHKICKTKTKTDFLVSDRSCPKTDGLRPHHWSGRALWAPSVVRGGTLTAQRFFTVFSTQDGLSWHYSIVLLWIKKWKVLHPFNLESITVHLVMLFFQYMRLNSQSESDKWWSSLQWRGEVDGGGIRHLGESPSSAQLRPHRPWRTGEIRGPQSYFKR